MKFEARKRDELAHGEIERDNEGDRDSRRSNMRIVCS